VCFCESLSITNSCYIAKPNTNQISYVRWISIAVAALIVTCSVGFTIWVIMHRKKQPVRESQHIFLIMICSGTLIMALTLIPLAIDDKTDSPKVCNIACNSNLWVFPIGLTVCFAALYSKIRRINLIMNAAISFHRLKVSVRDDLPPLIGLLLLNCLF